MKRHIRGQVSKAPSSTSYTLCCEVVDGLKPYARKELLTWFGKRISFLTTDDTESIFLSYEGDLRALHSLRTIVAVYLVEHFPIARPRALPGHEHYQRLLKSIAFVRSLHAHDAFSGFRISAAGEHSPVFMTLRQQLSNDLHLPNEQETGDLLLRIRPSSLSQDGWEVLVRLSPRPLSVRPWRIYNMKGALNATIAAAMIDMTQPQAEDRFLNIMCGSGTLLIERLHQGPAAIVAGCDINKDVLKGAQENVQASKFPRPILLMATDAQHLPFLSNSFDVICTDLPWGQLVGTHEQNRELYPAMFVEAARVATPQACFIVLTHEISLFEHVLQE